MIRSTLKIGVTGGIGSGKSTVCRMFEVLGAPYYDCDSRAREIMSEDAVLIERIKQEFGEQAYCGNEPDRPYLASKVFGDSNALAVLNSLVHPAVTDDFRRWVSICPATVPYIVMESAILFESGLENEVDHVITVSAPESVRIERAMTRDGATREKIEARMASQMTDIERERLSDYVINNDEKELVWKQVLMLDTEFKNEHNEDR